MPNDIEVATTLDKFKDILAERYDTLSNRLKQVADFISEEPMVVAFETMSVISVKAGVPISTLSRFANTFGFDGFSKMQVLFSDQYFHKPRDYKERIKRAKSEGISQIESIQDIFENLGESNIKAMEDLLVGIPSSKLEDAIALLSSANTIYVQGVRRAYPVASYLWYMLLKGDSSTVLVDGAGGMRSPMLKQIKKEDVLFITTFKPHAQESIAAIERAREVGAKIVAITDSQMSEHGRQADICFEIIENDVMEFRSLTSAMFIAQTLAVGLML
ncbi:MurR/RpiR family transcriptional regulator [Psychromonas arctica]|uniref:MurR/RpiR family transcriptional regulator n=1 Tax=Psychromonas arctica TaxID=168275 RepID=UPI002FD52D44